MSETIDKTWLKDKSGKKFAPRTLTSAIQDENGKPFQDYVDSMIVLANEDSTEVPEIVNNSSADIVTFTSGDGEGTAWTDVETMVSDETHSSLFGKISTMFKNIRYLFKMLGSKDISAIGDGTVTGGISTLNTNLEFHIGDTFTYTQALFGTSISSVNGASFGISIYLPKSIGNDVTSVSVRDDISWIRANGTMITLSNAHATVVAFSQNMVEVQITCDNLSALTFYMAVLRAPVTFTFE